MKKIFKILKRIILIILATIGLVILSVFIFVNIAPQFGNSPAGEHAEKMKNSPNYKGKQFVNQIPTSMDMSFRAMGATIREMITAKNTTPDKPLPARFSNGVVANADSAAVVTWYGHSAILLQMDGKRILIDPMFGPNASPVSFFGKRFDYEKPIDFSQFTNIDAVVISHDHYDHLDYPSIKKLEAHVKHFYVPLGVGAHLQKWGIAEDRITELDWWQSVNADGIELTAAPARHFSGRGIMDRNKTLWVSWIITGKKQKIFFSGDSGYGPHFKKIGEKFGPFDLAMIECGQYNEKWEAIHMMPEQSLQAGMEVKAKVVMPIHWGAFKLAMHSWTDGVERLTKAAAIKSVSIATPVIGEPFRIGTEMPNEKWWE